MNDRYLEVTYQQGRALAAYYYLPRRSEDKSYRTRRAESGLLVDYTRDGRPIGIEITTPAKTSLAAINRLLEKLDQKPVKAAEIAPLYAA